jgi:acid phosphatase (class A)
MIPVQILTVDQMPQAEKFLPDPPAQTDPLFFNDLVQFQKGKELRDTPRGAQAVEDASTRVEHYLKRFGEVMGREMTPEEYPHMASYVLSVYTAARQSISSTKKYYKRLRPYLLFKEHTSIPEREEENDMSSYPSGHTVRGWAVALALVSIDPEHQNEILKTGYEIGQSRVIAGYHYQSDVDAARLAGSAAFARLSSEPVFQDLFRKAKAEFDAKK